MLFKKLSRGKLIWRGLGLASKCFSLIGVPWTKFYAMLIDRIERDNDIEKVLTLGQLKSGGRKHKGLYDVFQGDKQLELLKVLGLRPDSKILELGLGYGRSAIPIIKFLDADNYHGTEISSKRLRMCEDWIDIEGLAKKKPNLVLVRDNSLIEFNGHMFDFVWAQGVVTHMPDHEFIKLLRSLKNVMRPECKFVFNYGVSDVGKCINQNVKDFYYLPEHMFNICQSEGYLIEELKVWHKYLHFGIDRKRNMALSLTLGTNT